VTARVVSGSSDPRYVREQYASEAGLAARKAVYRDVNGADARQIALECVALAGPASVLEVGCGEGELAERLARELGVRLIAVDQSERMVELTRARGIDARVADAESLPFEDGSFDVVVAAWMLYHVADLDRGLAELTRVLRPGGRLVATTNCADHLAELFGLAGIDHWELSFSGENAEERLARHFASVERFDADGTVVFSDIETVRSYYASSQRLSRYIDRLPAELDRPLTVRRRPVVFVAAKAA
jgi:SAM-dependent methyltransferase